MPVPSILELRRLLDGLDILPRQDIDAIRQARLARFKSAKPDWVESIDDPVYANIDAASLTQFLNIERVNTLARQLTVAGASGDWLRVLGANVGVFKKEGETDEELLLRIITEPAARAVVGTVPSIERFCYEASDKVIDVSVVVRANGQDVDAYIMSNENAKGEATDALITEVQTYINQDDRKHLQDTYYVQKPTFTNYQVSAVLHYYSDSYDPQPLIAEATTQVENYIDTQHRINTSVSPDRIEKAMLVEGVEYVTLTLPAAYQAPSKTKVYYNDKSATNVVITATAI